jgi:two-component system sensor histidine kinase ChiS
MPSLKVTLREAMQRAHPLVRLSYGPRTVAYAFGSIAPMLIANRPLTVVDYAFGTFGVVMSHVFFWGSLRFWNTGKAGRLAMHVDAMYNGVAIALMSGSNIASAGFTLVASTNPISVGGFPFLLETLPSLVGAFVVVKFAFMRDIVPGRFTPVGDLVAFVSLFAYQTLSAVSMRGQARRINRQRMELEARAQELEATAAKLRELDRLKDEFLATTSHELKTPINGIVGLAEGLSAGSEGPLAARVKERLELIVNAGRRLNELVANILNYAKQREQEVQPNLAPVDVRGALEEALTLVRPLIGKKNVELVGQIDPKLPPAMADGPMLQQVLLNAVGNAVKFTERGKVIVRVTQEGERVVFRVEDTGIGISPAIIDRVFDPFVQGDGGDTRRFGGTGLGLAVVKKIVEAHGGTVSIRSEEGKGTALTFDLAAGGMPGLSMHHPLTAFAPAAKGAGEAERVSVAPPARTSERGMVAISDALSTRETRPRVLIVDDEATNRAVLVTNLRSLDVAVDQAEDGVEALEKLDARGPYDLVLLDVMMPRMTGLEACKHMRERYGLAELPIILLTAKNRVEDIVEGFDAGASDYVPKPFSRREILARVRTHLLVRRTARAMARFVPDAILKNLGRKNLLDVELGDSATKQLTVLFADIRGFTARSEKLGAEGTMAFVNRLFAKIGPCVRDHGGFVDKYVGDGVIGLFERSPADACAAALAMLEMVDELKSEPGFEGLAIGIGVATGSVLLGTVGEERRFDATVLGDAVNLASRLESMTKLMGVPLLCCPRTLARVTSSDRVELARVRVAGREAIEIVGTLKVCFPVDRAMQQRWYDLAHVATSRAAFDARRLEGLDAYRRIATLHQDHGQAHPEGGLFLALDGK